MRVAFILVALAAAACAPMKARDVGEQLFSDPALSPSTLNAFSCATCHSMGDANGAIKAGFDLKSAAKRERFWGGYSPSLLDATNDCLVFFMQGTQLDKTDPKARALYEYLDDAATGSTDTATKSLTVVENITVLAEQGKTRGAQVWDAACKGCHGDPHTGAGRIEQTASIVPEDSQKLAKEIAPQQNLDAGTATKLIVIEKVRHGAFFGIGGTMPLFSKEQMSDDDIGALLSFLAI
jgi:thiosulfate dehydrogenase